MTSMLDTPHATVAYDELGSGPPIVMLSSAAHDRHDYDQVRALLADRFRTIAPDWPGHGESPAARSTVSAMAFADVAEALVEQLAPGGAVVVGNSVGGFSAARLAVRRPELVRGLVLVDSGGFAPLAPQERVFCTLMGRPGFLRRIYPAFSASYMRSRTDADRRAQRTSVAITREDPGLAAVAAIWRSFLSPEHDLREQAASIASPTLVIWGRRDPVIRLRRGRWIARTIPRARLAVLDSGHVPHTSQPAAFADELAAFAQQAFAGEGAQAAAA